MNNISIYLPRERIRAVTGGTGAYTTKTKEIDLGFSPNPLSGIQYKRYMVNYDKGESHDNVWSINIFGVGGEAHYDDNDELQSYFIGFMISGNVGLIFGFSGAAKIGYSWSK